MRNWFPCCSCQPPTLHSRHVTEPWHSVTTSISNMWPGDPHSQYPIYSSIPLHRPEILFRKLFISEAVRLYQNKVSYFNIKIRTWARSFRSLALQMVERMISSYSNSRISDDPINYSNTFYNNWSQLRLYNVSSKKHHVLCNLYLKKCNSDGWASPNRSVNNRYDKCSFHFT